MGTSRCQVCGDSDASLSPDTFMLTCHECTRSWHSICCIPPIDAEVMTDLRMAVNGLGMHNWQCKGCGDAQLRRFRHGGPDIAYVYWEHGHKNPSRCTMGNHAFNRNRKWLVKSEPPDDYTLRAADVTVSDGQGDYSNSAKHTFRGNRDKASFTVNILRTFMMDHLSDSHCDNDHRSVVTQEVKFWDQTARQVTSGAETRRRPSSLKDLCGRYHWVYKCQEALVVGFESDADSRGYDQRISRNHLELSLREGGDDGDVCGKFRFENDTFSFKGLQPKKDTINVWEVNELNVQANGHVKDVVITALEVTDDSGNPFLLFEWCSGCRSDLSGTTRSRLIGKKEPLEGGWRPFSESEREDLGINVDERIIRAVGILLDDPITRSCFEPIKSSGSRE